MPVTTETQLDPTTRCFLLVILNGDVIYRQPISASERIAVGRSADADLALAVDPSLSRLHFEVLGTPSGFMVRDLGSANGLFVQGQRVSEAVLANKDVIAAGRTTFVVQLIDDATEPTRRRLPDEYARRPRRAPRSPSASSASSQPHRTGALLRRLLDCVGESNYTVRLIHQVAPA